MNKTPDVVHRDIELTDDQKILIRAMYELASRKEIPNSINDIVLPLVGREFVSSHELTQLKIVRDFFKEELKKEYNRLKRAERGEWL